MKEKLAKMNEGICFGPLKKGLVDEIRGFDNEGV